jgi:hypothetical protein
MMQLRFWVALLFNLLAANHIFAASAVPIPDVNLRVAVRQKEDGKLGKSLHIVHLSCWQGDCALTWLTLNQCTAAVDGKAAFPPKIERSSTREGTLQVLALGDVIEVKETDPDATTTLRIGYKKRANAVRATQVTSFSGGFVKQSDILGKVITVEYIPFLGAYSAMKLDCAVLLPGVDPSNK